MTTEADDCLLIGDLGGTNARFALADPGRNGFRCENTLPTSDFESAEDAMMTYLDDQGAKSPSVISLAVAGPVVNGSVRFLNNAWSLEESALQDRFAGAQVRLVNDFTGIAYSLPLLTPSGLEPIGSRRPQIQPGDDFTLAVLGPGTGLGVSGLVGRGGTVSPLASEGGHVGFAPETAIQVEVLGQLREQFERVSDERLLSGPGIENIFWAMRRILGLPPRAAQAGEVFRMALDNRDEAASETVQLFFEALGQAAGNLALTLGAYDGVYIAGGIVQRYPELLKSSSFRSGFENKGRYRALMESIPTSLITHPHPGLLGAGFIARMMANGGGSKGKAH